GESKWYTPGSDQRRRDQHQRETAGKRRLRLVYHHGVLKRASRTGSQTAGRTVSAGAGSHPLHTKDQHHSHRGRLRFLGLSNTEIQAQTLNHAIEEEHQELVDESTSNHQRQSASKRWAAHPITQPGYSRLGA